MPDPTREYILYGGDISYFTRKLQAALRFYGLPFRYESKTPDIAQLIETRAGTHQVPVLQTPENWVLADTTPILDLLDARVPERRLFPQGPLGVLVHVCEEVLDEWSARVMVHYRWHYAENTRFIAERLTGRELTEEQVREFPVANWGRRACRATGTEAEPQQRAAEREYHAILEALEDQLGRTRYALGDRPTAVDAILLGGLRAHTHNDPIPDVTGFGRVVEWCEKRADEWDGQGELAPFPESTPFARHLIGLSRDIVAPFQVAVADARAAGEKAFSFETYGEDVSYLAREYPAWSRELVRERVH